MKIRKESEADIERAKANPTIPVDMRVFRKLWDAVGRIELRLRAVEQKIVTKGVDDHSHCSHCGRG